MTPTAVAQAAETATSEPGETDAVAVPPTPDAPPAEFDLAEVDQKWPAIVARIREEAGPRRFAFFREARPAEVDGSTLVLEIPEQFTFHLEALSEDDRLNAIVIAVLSEALGGATRVSYRSGAVDVEPDVATSEDPVRAPDESELTESEDGGIDPTDLVVDLLGGEVVE